MPRNGNTLGALPRYKSTDYFPDFEVAWEDNQHLRKFKHDRELTSDTNVSLDHRSIMGKARIRIRWKRKTQQGNESFVLGWLTPTEIFLEFLDDLAGRKRSFWESILGTRWKITFGVLDTACRVAEDNHDRFKEIVRTAKNIDEFMALSAIE